MGPEVIRLSAAERRKLNTFFSNFVEAYLQPFRRNQLSDFALVSFAQFHEYLNSPNALKGKYPRFAISASRVDSMCIYYFGKKVNRHQSRSMNVSIGFSRHEYRNGSYYFTIGGDGEAVSFAQIQKLRHLEGSLFEAEVIEYIAPNGWDGDRHASSWRDSTGDGIPEPERRFRGLIQKVGTEKNQRFILLEYTLIK
ncbi:MAG: hypothetical protein QM758_03635 [Armatimonas sp.]